jgi:hypothetical protein
MRRLAVVAVAIGLLPLGGCVVQSGRPVVAACPAPPPLHTEVLPRPPLSEEPLVWQPGHWDWNGSTYTWRDGAWLPRAGRGTSWLDGYWTTASGSCVWVPAHWVNPQLNQGAQSEE